MFVNLKINITKIIKTSVVPKITKLINKAFNEKYLLVTNVGISVILSGLGDVLQQNLEIVTSQRDKWDSVRTKNMSLSGGSVGVVCHYWYYHLDKFLPGYSLKIVLKKILADQVIGSPLYISTFFITINLLENSTKDKFIQDIKNKAWKLYFAEWMIWPPAQFINFYFLSTKFRVLFDNTISLGYDVYTSHVQHSPIAECKKNIS